MKYMEGFKFRASIQVGLFWESLGLKRLSLQLSVVSNSGLSPEISLKGNRMRKEKAVKILGAKVPILF